MMSMECREIIVCPKCRHRNEFTMWKSLNGDLDPVAKQSLLDGTLFRFECENCGHDANVDYPILYHDMKHGVMVYYVNTEDVEKTKEMFSDHKMKDLFDLPDYRNRIVTSQNVLREKALIFENELDDRVIELMKVFYREEVRKSHPDAVIEELLLWGEKGEYLFIVLGSQRLQATFAEELYLAIQTSYAEKLKEAEEEYIIDFDWAINFLNKE